MSLSSNELARMAGITHRQLNNWVRQGWLLPDGGVRGTGNQQWFSGDQVARTVVMADLTNAGVLPAVAYRLVMGDSSALDAFRAALDRCSHHLATR